MSHIQRRETHRSEERLPACRENPAQVDSFICSILRVRTSDGDTAQNAHEQIRLMKRQTIVTKHSNELVGRQENGAKPGIE